MIALRSLIIISLLASSQWVVAAPPAIPVVAGPAEMMSAIEKAGRDGRPVVVHLFATWCAPCREEMPLLRKVIVRARKAGAEVLLFSLDEPKDAESKVPRFLAKHRIDATSYVLDAPDSDAVTKAIDPEWSASLPATFVFRGGKRVLSIREPLPSVRALDSAMK